eukprot:c19458_g1_i5 orf=1120-2256(+)
MSHEVYNYGEGLMGKVAADNSHKWVYKTPLEQELHYPSSWQGAIDLYPRMWDAQFQCGIETIAIVAVKEGLIQLGSLKKVVHSNLRICQNWIEQIMEDLNFVLYVQRTFNYLESIPGVCAPHAFHSLKLKRTSSDAVESSLNHDRINWFLQRDLQESRVSVVERPVEQIQSVPSPCLLTCQSQFLDAGNQKTRSFAGDSSAQNSSKFGPQNSQLLLSLDAPVHPRVSSLLALLSKLPSVTPPPHHLVLSEHQRNYCSPFYDLTSPCCIDSPYHRDLCNKLGSAVQLQLPFCTVAAEEFSQTVERACPCGGMLLPDHEVQSYLDCFSQNVSAGSLCSHQSRGDNGTLVTGEGLMEVLDRPLEGKGCDDLQEVKPILFLW